MIQRKACCVTAVFLGILFFLSSVCLADDLTTVRAALQARGARWHSGETSVSRLSMDEKRMRVGLIKPTHTEGRGVLSRSEIEPPVSLPASLDWRNNGGNFVSGVRNQGNCGSCWAFATTAALEASLLRAGVPASGLDLSEQVLVSCGGSGSCNGGYISYASDYIRNTGLPNEGCYPYGGTDGTCTAKCVDWQTQVKKVASWSWVTTTSTTVDTLKNALYTYGPLVTTMDVYGDFYYYTSGVYTHTSGSLLGGHAVLLVGYDDAGQYFIVKNSWGTGWGEAGYFKIAYGEVNGVVNFGDWTIAYQSAGPTCSYALSATSASVDDPGSTGSVNVTTSSTCAWTASSNAAWITITSGTSSTGNGTVYYSVQTNTGADPRSGTMTIAGQAFTVTQEGQGCSFTVKQLFPASSGTGQLRVSAASGCAWQAASSDPWVTITSGASGTGSGKVGFSVSANTGTGVREATITAAGKSWGIYQEGMAQQTCTYGITPASQSFTSAAGTGSVSVSATTGCAWTASSNATWITITSGGSGAGNGTVNVSVTANTTTSSRSGTITAAGKTFTVTQAAAATGTPDIGVNPTSLNFGNVIVGKTTSQKITVSNTGTGTLTFSSVTLTSSYTDFKGSHNCTSVAPSGTCTVTISFTPSLGARTANLKISSNDPDENPLYVNIKGAGVR
jgi:C1A family cysteine protease